MPMIPSEAWGKKNQITRAPLVSPFDERKRLWHSGAASAAICTHGQLRAWMCSPASRYPPLERKSLGSVDAEALVRWVVTVNAQTGRLV